MPWGYRDVRADDIAGRTGTTNRLVKVVVFPPPGLEPAETRRKLSDSGGRDPKPNQEPVMRTSSEPLRRVTVMHVVVLLALLVPVGCAPGSPSDDARVAEPEPVERGTPDQAEAVHDFRNHHMTALTDQRDTERILSHFTQDAAYLPPGGEAVVGHDAIRAYLADFFSGALFGVNFDNHQTLVDGDVAVLRDTYDMVIVPRSGAQSQHSGEDVWVLRRVDGEWRIALVMWTEHTLD